MENKKGIFQKIKNLFSNHKKLSIGIISLLLVIIIGLGIKAFTKKNDVEISSNEVAILAKEDLVNSINETGKVVASTSMDVFAEKTLPIDTLYVKEGDRVSEGDIIAELDSSTIRQQIATKEAARAANRKSVGSQISQAKNRLTEAMKNKKDGTNSALVSANNSVTSAFDNWKAAEKAYNDYKKSLEERYNPEIVAEKNNRQNLSYQEKSGSLKFKQLQEDLQDNIKKSRINRDLAASKEREKESLQQRYNELDRLNTELSIRSSENSQEIAKIQAEIGKKEEMEKMGVGSGGSSTENNSDNPSGKKEKKMVFVDNDPESISEKERKIDNIRKENYDITRQQDELKREMTRLQELISTANSDMGKYSGEADSLDKEIEMQNKNLDQSKVEMEKAREDIQSNEDTAAKNQKAREDQLKTLKQNEQTAHNAYLAALEALESTKTQVDHEINTLRDSVKTASAGLNNVDDVDLKYLAEDLEKTVIKAPTSGTITSLQGKEGLAPSGAIATIETVERLQVESHVKEYNIQEVQVGTKVIVTSDAIEGQEFEGKVISVSPTPKEKAQGDTSTDVFYKTVIELQPKDMDSFNPGMTLRVKYILSEEKDTFTIPTTAIFDRDQKSYILAVDGKDETGTVVKLEVTTGLENDFETAIQGKKLKDGMRVLASPAGYSEGQKVRIQQNQPKDKGNAAVKETTN